MRAAVISTFAILGVVLGAALTPPLPIAATAPIVLSFDYPTNGMDTNLVFVLHGTSDVGSLLPWGIEQNLPASAYWTNGWSLPVTGTNYTVTFTNQTIPGIHFWYVTASNFWGTSDPSNVLPLPPLPGNTSHLKAQRGW